MFKEGDHSSAICHECECVVFTTMHHRDVPFDDGSGVVKNILVAVCDTCGQIVAIPAQSVKAIAETRRKDGK